MMEYVFIVKINSLTGLCLEFMIDDNVRNFTTTLYRSSSQTHDVFETFTEYLKVELNLNKINKKFLLTVGLGDFDVNNQG